MAGDITASGRCSRRVDGCVVVRLDGRNTLSPQHSPPAEGIQTPHVGEVHDADHQSDTTDLGRQQLHDTAAVIDLVGRGHEERDVAEVQQVEADDQQLVDGVSQSVVTVEDVDQEDLAVPAQGPGHPDGERHGDGEVQQVSENGQVHDNLHRVFERVQYRCCTPTCVR